MRRRIADAGLLVAGIAMIAAGIAHAFGGWPPLGSALAALGAARDLAGPLAVGWAFGSLAMVAFGAIVLLGRRDCRHGGAMGAAACRVVGVAYMVFGVGATVYRWPNPHFLGFIALGVLALLPAARRPGH